jgi:hypothetical protein
VSVRRLSLRPTALLLSLPRREQCGGPNCRLRVEWRSTSFLGFPLRQQRGEFASWCSQECIHARARWSFAHCPCSPSALPPLINATCDSRHSRSHAFIPLACRKVGGTRRLGIQTVRDEPSQLDNVGSCVPAGPLFQHNVCHACHARTSRCVPRWWPLENDHAVSLGGGHLRMTTPCPSVVAT